MTGRHDDLNEEVRELRSLTQAVRTELARLDRPAGAARHLGYVLVRAGWRRVRRLRRRLRRTPDPTLAAQHTDFVPYAVRRPPAIAGRRPRVLHAIANFMTGGSARLVVDLVERLGSEFEQRVVVRTLPEVTGYVGLDIDEYRDLTGPRPLRQLLRRFRPDVVHVHYFTNHRRLGVQGEWSWYFHVFTAAEQYGSRLVENVNVPTEPYRSDAIDRYVFVSEHVRQRFARPGDSCDVVYPGSDLTHFRNTGPAPPSDTIGLVYRLEPDKLDESSIDPVVDALRRRPDARAIVIGGGTHLGAYEDAVRAAGVADRVSFPGYLPYAELPAWYAKMALFVAPVHTESFGQVSVFAMGMELPVAGYRVGALEEILGDEELLAPAGDTGALADILVGILDQPERAREIGARNRRRAIERFSVERMVEGYRRIYQNLTEAPRRSGPA